MAVIRKLSSNNAPEFSILLVIWKAQITIGQTYRWKRLLAATVDPAAGSRSHLQYHLFTLDNWIMMQSSAEKELKQVLRHYGLGRLQNAQQLERGYVNENWIINTTGGRFFLKHRYPCLRSPRLIHAQHALTEHLRQSGFPAPEILTTKSGDTLLMLDERFYEIQIYIEGGPYRFNRFQHFQAAAAMLGRYHLSVDGFSNQAFSEQGKLYCPQVLNDILTNLMKEWKTCGDPRVKKIFRQLKSNAKEQS